MNTKLLITTLLVATATSQAILIDRGSGLIYDTEQNLTWLQDMNPAGDAMNWNDAMTWVDNFTYAGLDDWRLPSGPFEPVWGGELGHLYFNSLGNPVYDPRNGEARSEIENVNLGPFINSPFATPYRAGVFWMNTEVMPGSDAWIFSFDSRAATDHSSIFGEWFAWPVRNGDAVSVPDTGSTLLLFSMSLACLMRISSKRWR
jgi:hypothetical protein